MTSAITTGRDATPQMSGGSVRRVSIDFRFRGQVLLGMAPAPIAVVSDNGPRFSREVFKTGFDGPHPLPRHVRNRGAITPDQRRHRKVVRHHRFPIIYNTIRPHQALGDRTPSAAYTGCDQ